MSEAMSTSEIEDVLSSIRRLVSDEFRQPPVSVGRSAPGKLILTPALRVVPPLPLAADVPPESPAPAQAPLAARVAVLGAAVGNRTGEWEAEQPEDRAPLPETPEAGFWSDEGDAAWPGDFAGDWAEPETFEFIAFPQPEVLRDLAEAEAAPGIVDGSSASIPFLLTPARRADLDRVDSGAPSVSEAETAVPDTAVTAAGATDWLPEESAPVVDPVEFVHRPAVPEVKVPAAALFTANWANAASRHALPGRADTFPQGITASDPFQQIVSEDGADVAKPRDLPLAEEALRDLVRETIRQELQGPLGERITRNIRKLVRAEVARALTVQTLD